VKVDGATRREFARGVVAASAAIVADGMFGQNHTPTGNAELDARQCEIDAITPGDFEPYVRAGADMPHDELTAFIAKFPVIGRLEAAFEKVFREVKETVVTDINRPAVWYVYNMGFVIKTPKTLFSIDLHHRRAEEFAPLLDFALITHNHYDHYTDRFKVEMDRKQRKTVINNFFDNYGVRDRKFGGYTRAPSKTFQIGDVKVITGLCDHNTYLIDYTTPFEIQIGDYTIYHSGDCCSHAKLHVTRQPDMWVFHPYCGMKPEDGCREAIHPKLAVIAHLQEMGHAKGRYRWTYRDGINQKNRLEEAGFAALMPLWGERLV